MLLAAENGYVRLLGWIIYVETALISTVFGQSAVAPDDVAFPDITPGPTMTLREAIAAVDAQNLRLKTAEVALDAAAARLGYAISGVLPTLSAEMTYVHHDHEDRFEMGDIPGIGDVGDSVITPQDELSGSLTATLPIIRSETWRRIRTAKTDIAYTELTVETVRQQLLFKTAEAYYVALMAQEIISLHENAIRTYTEHVRTARAREASGAGLKIDVLRAKTDRDQAYQQLLAAHLAFDNARDALRVLTGVSQLPMPTAEAPSEPPEGGMDALEAGALRDRIDLKTTRAFVALKERELGALWMQFLPTLDGALQGSYQFNEPGDMGADDRARWAILLQLNIPLYNQYRYADLDAGRAAVKQALFAQKEAARNIAGEVRSARRNYQTALAAVKIAERQVKMSEETLALTQSSYETGTGSSLEVTDARRTALSAEVGLATRRLEAQIAALSLRFAIGEDMARLGRAAPTQ